MCSTHAGSSAPALSPNHLINALFATHLQDDLHLSTALIATPIMLANLLVFLAS